MISDYLFNHIAQETTLVSYDPDRESISIRACDATPAMIDSIEKLGFSRDCSHYWTLTTSAATVPDLVATLRPIVGEKAVWDAGKVFGTEHDWSQVTMPEVPETWNGLTAIRVCETGHAVLFSPDESEQELRSVCSDLYQSYLLREFHPSE